MKLHPAATPYTRDSFASDDAQTINDAVAAIRECLTFFPVDNDGERVYEVGRYGVYLPAPLWERVLGGLEVLLADH